MQRITNQFLSNQSINYLHGNLGVMADLQEKLSSGKNINKPSDDPIGTTRILDLSNTLNIDQRHKRNIEQAISEVNMADTVMGNMVNLITRTQELATQAANLSNSQDGRNAIALEIDQIINQMVQLGNTDIGGKYIFGGFVTDTPPFTRVGDNITYNGSPASGNWERQAEISEATTLTINTNGENLLGQATAVAALPLPAPPGTAVTGSGLFQTMVELLTDLRADGDPNQIPQIRERLDDLSTDLNAVAAQQAIVGSISNRLELTKNRIDEREAILTQQFADIQNVDMASMIANLNNQENVFQASLGITARVNQVSLLNFLR